MILQSERAHSAYTDEDDDSYEHEVDSITDICRLNDFDELFSIQEQQRSFPMTHPPAEAPLCSQCQSTEAAYFDLSCLKCLQRLVNPKTGISEIFAVMRQWNPHTQRSIKFLVQQVA